MRSTIWKKTLICLGAVLFLESPAVSTAFAYTVKAENTDAEAATSNIKSILLIGQDKREGESRQRSDSMILATLDKDQGTVSLTSFMRDLYVAIPGYSTTRINAAYAYGGMDLLDQTLEENFGVKIDGNVEVDFEVFQVLVDKVGGIDLELTQAEADYICGRDQSVLYPQPLRSDWNLQEGMNHLDGVQAVAYGRLRLMDTDYARTERQRKIIAQAFEKAKKADFQTLYTLIGTVFPQVSTSVWVDDLVSNAKNINKFHLGETTGFPQARGDANMGKKGAVVVPATLESNVIELHKFLFGDESYTPSETVKKISAKISSDTGIYKEGQFVGNVGTGDGVVQPQKTTAASKKSSEKSKDEEGYQTVYEYDKNGKKVSRKLKLETDADGKYVKYETDADGFLVKDETISSSHASTTAVETDANGNPVETESRNNHKNNETSASESGIADTKVTDRPGSTTESSSASHPGSSTETTSSGHTGTTTPTSAASHPGSSTTPTTPAAHPGSTGESTTSGSGSTVPTAASHPGSSTAPTSAASHPGSSSTTPTGAGSGNISSGGPSGSGNGSSSSSGSGPVSAPGQ